MEHFGSAALQRLIDDLPGAVTESHAKLGDATAVVEASRLIDVMTHLRDELPPLLGRVTGPHVRNPVNGRRYVEQPTAPARSLHLSSIEKP